VNESRWTIWKVSAITWLTLYGGMLELIAAKQTRILFFELIV